MITKEIAQKVLEVVNKGLCSGLDEGYYDGDRPQPGHMCVEAAVCYAFGEEHGDRPKCVDDEISTLKIALNDADNFWTSNKDRARHLRRLAIAQLGSKETFKKKGVQKKFEVLFKTALHKHFISKLETKKADDSYFEVVPISLSSFLKNEDCSLQDRLEGLLNGGDHGQRYRVSRKSVIAFCEEFVQILVKLKVPGTKYLYLTNSKKKK